MHAEGCFVHCQTVHTNGEKHHKEVLSSKSLVHLLPGADSCWASLYISKMSPRAMLQLCLKILLISSHLFLFCSLSLSLCPVSTDPGRRMGRWYYTIGRRWSTERMATAGRRGKMGRPHGRITWSWKCKELRWVGWQEFGFRGKEAGWGHGYGAGESQPSPWHRQTQVYSELSPGCNGDSHMLQLACVSKESHRETMQHNNSFPWEASGVEPIVCTLLRLWMLPLLQRAYINLAGSKQYCGASVPSTLPQVTTHTSRCHKTPSCICPWLTLAQFCSTWGGGNAILAVADLSAVPYMRPVKFQPQTPSLPLLSVVL